MPQKPDRGRVHAAREQSVRFWSPDQVRDLFEDMFVSKNKNKLLFLSGYVTTIFIFSKVLLALLFPYG